MSHAVVCSHRRSIRPPGMAGQGDLASLSCGACGYPIRNAHADTPAVCRPPTLLWIEDDEMILSVSGAVLEQHGYRLHVAPDGPTGIGRSRRERPALILFDIIVRG